MTLKELETQLQSFTTTERADAIQILTPSLNQALRGITKTIGTNCDRAARARRRNAG